uniref:ATP-dependent RNA helicase n=1 Tax=Panagrolaimus davidi TaxID=227884 RepID=A0A914PW43_9BILA
MSVMSTNKSDFVIDLQTIFNVPNTCQDVNVKEEFCWGAGDQQLFEGEAVEFDMESFIKDEEERTKMDLEETDFKVLGEEKFVQLKKIQIRPAWISSAKVFEKNVVADNCEKLKNFPGLKRALYQRIKENINAFFPVQASVLSYLLPLSSSIPLFPPRDIAVSAPTGSGKTLCYILPILNGLEHNDPSAVYAVILAPLQLLAVQIFEEFKKYNIYDASVVLLAGVQEYATERRFLFPNGSKTSKASIIIATPDRFVEHLTDIHGKIELSKLLKTANSTSIARLQSPEQNRWLQKILVSATLNLDVEQLFIWNLRCPRLFRSTGQGNDESGEIKPMEKRKIAASVALPSTIMHKVVICDSQRKPLDVYCWICRNPEWQRVMVFVNNNESLQRLTSLFGHMFKKDSKKVAGLSAEHFKDRRLRTIKQFTSGEINILISSDITGRGVDIPDIDCVINYDLPKTDRIFIHRAGRTARAGKTGTVLSFATKEEKVVFKKILAQRGYWNSVTEVPKEDLSNTKDKVNYKKSLEKLQAQFGSAE